MSPPRSSTFRYSDAFVKRATWVLIACMFVLPAVGIGLGISSDGDWAPEWLGTFAGIFTVGGFVAPILVAAILGGEAITRGGGLVGLLFTYGLVGGATGQALGIGWLKWTGIAALVATVVGFWVIGWIAKVPMYVGRPGAHGPVVQRKDPSPSHQIIDDDPRLRPKRPS